LLAAALADPQIHQDGKFVFHQQIRAHGKQGFADFAGKASVRRGIGRKPTPALFSSGHIFN
jgi:hypothetical protein